MKVSKILKSVGLYGPAEAAKKVADSCLLKAKLCVYRSKLAEYMSQVSGGYAPNVLVIMNGGGVGNVVEATPLVQAIRSFWPKSVITILSLGGDLLEDWCVTDDIVFSMGQLKDKSFDHTFCPYWDWSGYDELKGICRTGQFHKVKLSCNTVFLKPERQYCLDLLRRLGFRGDAPLYVSVKKPSLAIADASLRVCLVPGGKTDHLWRYKRWPYYAELAEIIADHRPEAQILLIGTESDHVPEQIHSNPNVIDLRGKLTLAETAWVLKNSDVAIGNDCGPMHIADAVQTKALIIFGPTCQLKNGPVYKAVPIVAQVDCRPCQYAGKLYTCDDARCIEQITAEYVYEKLGEYI